MKRRRQTALAVRMSDQEKLIVQFIVERFELAYRNANGKAVYARNLDQVMKDLFGIKRFTKTLQRARFNEGLMINLMKQLDAETLWGITRSKEHYRLLCTLVALDHQIVQMGKKYNRYAQLEMAERPVKKIKRLARSLKQSRKTYKACIRTMRDIFNIERPSENGGKNAILDSLNDWLDRYEYGEDDIFFDLADDSVGFDVLSSMDEYVANVSRAKQRGRQSRQQVKVGALGLFDDPDDIFDDDDEEDVDEFLGDIIGMQQDVSRQRPRATSSAQAAPGQQDLALAIAQLAKAIGDGFSNMNDRLDDLMGYDGDEEAEYAPLDGGPISGGPGYGSGDGLNPQTARTIDEIRKLQEATSGQQPERPVAAEQPSAPES